jgi:hypothetical protein
VSVDGLAVFLGEAAPGDETHHVRPVSHEDGSPLAVERAHDRFQRHVVNLLDGDDVLQAFGELKQRGLFLHASRERKFGLLAHADVMLDTHRVQEPAVSAAHARRRHLRPEEFPTALAETLLERIAVDFSG